MNLSVSPRLPARGGRPGKGFLLIIGLAVMMMISTALLYRGVAIDDRLPLLSASFCSCSKWFSTRDKEGLVVPASVTPQCWHSIPRIVHQTWKTAELPDWAQPLAATWDHVHNVSTGTPQWRHVIHTDEDNRATFGRVFPELLASYDKAKIIVQVDMARAAYLYESGGVYADLDVEALKPLDVLLATACTRGRNVILGRMDDPGNTTDNDHAIPNAIMAASRPGEAFWAFCAKQWAQNVDNGCQQAENCAGPMALRRCLQLWVANLGSHDMELRKETPAHTLWIVPKGVLYPHSWLTQASNFWCIRQTLNPERCKAKLDLSKAYTVAYWRHSWNKIR